MAAVLRMLIGLLVGIAAAMLFFYNQEQIVVLYWFKDLSTDPHSLSAVLFYAFLAGFAVAAVAGIADQIRLRARLRQMRRSTEKLEAELATLRSLPLGDERGALSPSAAAGGPEGVPAKGP